LDHRKPNRIKFSFLLFTQGRLVIERLEPSAAPEPLERLKFLLRIYVQPFPSVTPFNRRGRLRSSRSNVLNGATRLNHCNDWNARGLNDWNQAQRWNRWNDWNPNS